MSGIRKTIGYIWIILKKLFFAIIFSMARELTLNREGTILSLGLCMTVINSQLNKRWSAYLHHTYTGMLALAQMIVATQFGLFRLINSRLAHSKRLIVPNND